MPSRKRERNTSLEPIKQSAAVCKARPDKAYAVRYHKTDAKGRKAWTRKFFRTKAAALVFSSQKLAERVSLGNLAHGLSDLLKQEALACTERLKPYGKTLSDAVNYYIADLALTEKSTSVEKAAQEMLVGMAKNRLSGRHIKATESYLNQFSLAHGKDTVATVNAQKIQAWLESKKMSDVTFNTKLRYLRSFFAFCLKRKYAKENPANEVSFKKVMSAVPRLLSPSDLRVIIAASDEAIRPALVLQAFCGVRSAELARVEWKDILQSGHLQIGADKAKTAKRRLTPIPSTALRYLLSVRKASGAIFPAPKVDAWVKERKEAGEAPSASEVEGRRTDALNVALHAVKVACPGIKWGSNALRASALSYRLAETKDAAATALEMGNSPAVLLRDYRELTTGAEASEWFAVNPSNASGSSVKFLTKKRQSKAG
jgi:site-specific recombinase XerD